MSLSHTSPEKQNDTIKLATYYLPLQNSLSRYRMQSVPINTIVSPCPAHGEVYSIQHYVIKSVSDLRQVCDFLWVLWFPPLIKQNATL
jgi:hypothetical protein